MLGSIALASSNAQTLREAQPPAEFPPSTFKGKQYVDSRGCIYIRAGVNGNVTWVPRVTRSRKQLCGYKPTQVAGATSAPTAPQATRSPTLITLAPADRADAKPSATRAPAPKVAAARKPSPPPVSGDVASAPAAKPTPHSPAAQAPGGKSVAQARSRVPSPAPAPTVFVNPPKDETPVKTPPKGDATARVATATPATRHVPSPAPAPTVWKNPQPKSAVPTIAPRKARRVTRPRVVCPNASPFSQQFINEGARCGPQKLPPVPPRAAARKRAVALAPDTRIIPRHVYENRQNTIAVSVPKGYRPVWKDGRLNPHRAERTARPGRIVASAVVPRGFRRVDRGDDRYNTRRGAATAQGDAQTDMIWTRTVPRRLIRKPVQADVVKLPNGSLVSPAEARPGLYLRLSTRSAPTAPPATGPAGADGGR